MRHLVIPLLAVGLVLCLPASLVAKKAETTTSVDCTDPDPKKHGSINAALLTKGEALIINISGICEENIDIRRDDVTLIGSDPDLDGIKGADTGDPFAATVRIRDARGVRLENLQITGGTFSGVEIQDTIGDNDIVNCHIEDNGNRGIHVVSSFLNLTDTVISGNGTTSGTGRGIQVGFASGISCSGCTIEDNHPDGNDVGIYALRGGNASVRGNSSVSARYAVATDLAGFVGCNNSELTALPIDDGFGLFGFAAWADTGSQINLNNCDVDGSLRVERQSYMRLRGSSQDFNTSASGNEVIRDAQLELHPRLDMDGVLVRASNLVGTTNFRDFSTGVFRRQAEAGDLVCDDGSDARCDGGVTFVSSDCGLCPEP